ncbi:MAG: flavodoxin-dependent (E)-4-hydroxy-3-methylbut-2-enyl-diphosphate synthase, partial [Clostridiales bacterium]|nr:flavodoxin-dependent (E)-4-hydroxy-3-methylbut-2-enyl-diphosphate synthase [Clostridiales bacterium]
MSPEELWIKAAADFGPLFIDGLADGLDIVAEGVPQTELDALALAILQAARVRISHTEYIACPGCGRTLYDLQGTLAAIRSRTEHLKGLKIGVMG